MNDARDAFGQEAVFRALAHEIRRDLLVMLLERPGLTLTELCGSRRITRQTVSQHLEVLAEAGLVVSRKVGREKLHYLNAVPIAEVVHGWLAPFLTGPAAELLRIRNDIERGSRRGEATGTAGREGGRPDRSG